MPVCPLAESYIFRFYFACEGIFNFSIIFFLNSESFGWVSKAHKFAKRDTQMIRDFNACIQLLLGMRQSDLLQSLTLEEIKLMSQFAGERYERI